MKNFAKIGIGDNRQAVEQATSGLINPKCIVYYCIYTEIEEIYGLLVEKYPEAYIIGASSSSYHNSEVYDTTNFVIQDKRNVVQVFAFFDDAEIECGVIDRLDKDAILNLKDMDEKAKKIRPEKGKTVCLAFNTDHEEIFVSTTKVVLEKYNIPLVAGTIGGFFCKGEDPYIYFQGKRYYHASAYILIKNKVGRIKTYKQDIYKKTDGKLYTITKMVDKVNHRTVGEIDGKTLDMFFSERHGITVNEYRKDPEKYTLKYPLAVVVGENLYAVSVFLADKDSGAVSTFKNLYEGGVLTFLEIDDYDTIEKNLITQIKKDMPNTSFVFDIDCVYRYILYNNEKYLDKFLNGMSTLGTHVGMISAGEANEVQHFNQTMMCAVFE